MPKHPYVVGHRGFPTLAPENSARSFELALIEGVDAVELDVQLTADERALVHHDDTTDRLCGIAKRVRDLTLDQCRAMRIRDSRPPEESNRLISLDEALSILRPDTDVDIELKGRPEDARALCHAVAESVDRTGGPSGILITSASTEMLSAMHKVHSSMRMGFVLGSRSKVDVRDLLTQVPLHWIVPNQERCTRNAIRQWHRLGLGILPYTVNERKDVTRLIEWGVDGLISDDPRRVKKWISPERTQSRKKGMIVVDLGSTSSKVAFVNENLEPSHVTRIPVQNIVGKNGEIGLDAKVLFRSVDSALTHLINALSAKVDGLVLTSQRSTFVAWDRHTGEPVGDAPSWRCLRSEHICKALAPHRADVLRRTGLPLNPHYSATKMRMKIAQAMNPDRILVAPLPTYLAWLWSGGRLFKTDPTLAGRTLLMNLETLNWDPFLLQLFGVPKQALPRIVPTRSPFGSVQIGRTRMSIRAMVGDQQAALAGLTGGRMGEVAINFGTGAFVLRCVKGASEVSNQLPLSVAWTDKDSRQYVLEGTVHRMAPAFESLRDFAKVDIHALSELLVEGRPGQSLVLPAEEGLGSPYWQTRRRSEVLGSHNIADVAVGLVYAFGFMMRDNLDATRLDSPLPMELVVGGGLSRSPHVMQLLADSIGLEICVSKESEVTIRGAAALAQFGSWSRPPIRSRFSPRVGKDSRHALHASWSRAFKLDRFDK